MSTEIQIQISDAIKNNPVILYMKGTKYFPQCGFSKAVVDILSQHEVEFETVDVLESEEVRQGIKDHSSWPTLPQLFIKGKFVGGCDIVTELHSNGELEKLLQDVK